MDFPPLLSGWRATRRWWRMRDCCHPEWRLWCLHDTDSDEVVCMDCDRLVDIVLDYCSHTGELHSEMDF